MQDCQYVFSPDLLPVCNLLFQGSKITCNCLVCQDGFKCDCGVLRWISFILNSLTRWTNKRDNFVKPRSIAERFLALPSAYLFFFSFVDDHPRASADDVIISQLQAISQFFSSYPPSGGFCQVNCLDQQGPPTGIICSNLGQNPSAMGAGHSQR